MKNLPGFTLIELLIVVAMIGVLTGVGLASYNKFNEKQRVQQAALDFAIELRKVQKRANSGELHASCAGPLEKYQVRTSTNSQTVVIRVYCGGAYYDDPQPNIKEAIFDNNYDFTFLPLGRGIEANVTATMVGVRSGYQCEITANTGGIITISEVVPIP